VDKFEARLAVHAVGRRMLSAAVRRLPLTLSDALRRGAATGTDSRWSPANHRVVSTLRLGGIPARASTFVLADNPELTFVNADSLVLRQLYWLGQRGWEPELLPPWLHLCSRASSIVEIGANVGYYTVQGARAAPHARYVAVEPHPVAADILLANLRLNGIDSVRLIRAAAVGPTDATLVQLRVPRQDHFAAPAGGFVGSASELPAHLSHHIAEVIETPAVNIEELLTGTDLIKLDVEGYEHALLSAAEEYLREYRPSIVVEVLRGTPRLRALLSSLCTHSGFRFYAPSPSGLVEVHPQRIADVDLRKEFQTRDVILTCWEMPSPLLAASAAAPAAGGRSPSLDG